jgi:hypothetical protein
MVNKETKGYTKNQVNVSEWYFNRVRDICSGLVTITQNENMSKEKDILRGFDNWEECARYYKEQWDDAHEQIQQLIMKKPNRCGPTRT